MMLRDQLQADLMAAMKVRDEVTLSTLRMLKSAIGAFEVSGKEKKVATEEEVLELLKREAKKRRESIRQFEEGNRHDLAQAEQAELVILEAYLPTMMSEDQVREIVAEVVGEVGATGPADMGKVMGASMRRLQGQADGGVVRAVVAQLLGEL